MCPEQGVLAEDPLRRSVMRRLDLGVTQAEHFRVMMDGRHALRLASLDAPEHQEHVIRQVVARAPLGICLGRRGREPNVGGVSDAGAHAPFVLAHTGQRCVGILLKDVAVELQQARREQVGRAMIEEHHDAGRTSPVGRAARNRQLDRLGVGLPNLAAVRNVADGRCLGAARRGQIGIRPQKAT